jgi:CRP-like cAMP-binding protein
MKRSTALKGLRNHVLSPKMKALATSALAQKIGYLRIEDFPETTILETLQALSLGPHRIIRCNDELYLIKQGSVEIWHTHHDFLVKELTQGALFGEMPLLGQTMVGTQAITGTRGAVVAVVDVKQAEQWVKSSPLAILEKLGYRLAQIDVQHYRAGFQLADARVAALLLDLAGPESVVAGLSHDELGDKAGLYRETVTVILKAMKLEKLIELRRKRITILDREALQKLSTL